ncbi:MAG: TIGR03619 family F420-dependent LLM class oxidoreductase [Chloroflexi bacterium]|nr:TIGR03619 family F420-dependent LLM class oxidoreductase [Chloroflexota bacterium]
MKISYRIGVMPGPLAPTADLRAVLWDLIDRCEASEIDSLWFSERLSSPTPVLEPIVTMATLAARTRRLKFGPSVLTLPFRTPVVLARELAMLDVLSGGRMLPAVGIGAEDERAFHAAGVPVKERARRTDEAVRLMRSCWSEERVTFDGQFWQLDDVTVLPRPVQQPLPLWIGGNSEAAMRRAGRLGDGWIPSFITPERLGEGVKKTLAYAEEAGREVPIDHFGAVVYYCLDADPRAARQFAMPFIPPGRADAPTLERCTAFGPPALVRERLEEYVAAGGSKFVLRPICPPDRMLDQLDALAAEVVPDFQRRR